MKNSHKSYYLLVLNLILGIFGSCDKGEIETLRTDIHTEEESHTGTPLEEDNSAENLSFLRAISQSNYNDVGVETYRYEAIYDGKKIKSYKTYTNGHLSSSTEDSHNGLVCTLTSTYYDTNTGQETAKNKTKIEYLDDTYLRTISQSNYNDAGVETYRYEAIYDGKKIKSSKTYTNGHLSSSTENSYNGLVCTSTITSYDINIGKVIARNKIKIEYLE